MELRHIRYFLVLAEELNFSRAAERLRISQPPLSRQIRELEEEIGARLFHRTKRKVELTEAGKVFMKRAYQILDQVEQARISTRLSSGGNEGEFRIGFNGSIQDLIPTLQHYRARFPKVGIILQHMSSNEQIEALNEKRIDIGTIAIPNHSSKIEVYPLQMMHFMAALPEEHPLLSKLTLHMQDLADETFILTPKSAGPLYYEMIMNIFKNANFSPKLTIQAHDLHSILALVAGGLGITLTPTPINSVHGVINRKVEDVNLSIQPSMAWRKDNRSEILKNFLDFFFEFYGDRTTNIDG